MLQNFQNITAPMQLIQAANQALNGALGLSLYFTVFVIVFVLTTNRAGAKKAFVTASIVGLFIAMPLVYLDLLNVSYIGLSLALVIISSIVITLTKD